MADFFDAAEISDLEAFLSGYISAIDFTPALRHPNDLRPYARDAIRIVRAYDLHQLNQEQQTENQIRNTNPASEAQ